MKLYAVGLVTDDDKGLDLASVIAKRGFSVSLYMTSFDTLTSDEQSKLMNDCAALSINVSPDMESFILSLEEPKKVFMYSCTQDFNSRILMPLLAEFKEDDVLANLCDMNYIEAGKIVEEQKKRGVYYLPTGFPRSKITVESGISIMPGGYYDGFDKMRSVFTEIAARDEEGFVCCPYIGPAGSGQYVKMVVNGLEYALLEINAELISLIKSFCTSNEDDLVEILSEINSTESESFFLEMFMDIYSRYDAETGLPITAVVSDYVEYGRGVVWMCNEGMNLGIPMSMVSASLEHRFLSSMRNERIASSKMIGDLPVQRVPESNRRLFIERLRKCAYLSGICAFAQCFGLLRSASEKYNWDLDLLAISRTMQVNSYTRSRCLNRVIEAFDRHNKLLNLFTDPYFQKCASSYSNSLRYIINTGISGGIAMPAMSAALQYIDQYRSLDLNSGIIQLSRDYINESGFQRKDKPGIFNANWENQERVVQQKLLGSIGK
ncbi:MAG: hypothetical protein J5850_06360 [Clostridia bacterium]|nr:hypothetical protein [Clostridia bacterium]